MDEQKNTALTLPETQVQTDAPIIAAGRRAYISVTIAAALHFIASGFVFFSMYSWAAIAAAGIWALLTFWMVLTVARADAAITLGTLKHIRGEELPRKLKSASIGTGLRVMLAKWPLFILAPISYTALAGSLIWVMTHEWRYENALSGYWLMIAGWVVWIIWNACVTFTATPGVVDPDSAVSARPMPFLSARSLLVSLARSLPKALGSLGIFAILLATAVALTKIVHPLIEQHSIVDIQSTGNHGIIEEGLRLLSAPPPYPSLVTLLFYAVLVGFLSQIPRLSLDKTLAYENSKKYGGSSTSSLQLGAYAIIGVALFGAWIGLAAQMTKAFRDFAPDVTALAKTTCPASYTRDGKFIFFLRNYFPQGSKIVRYEIETGGEKVFDAPQGVIDWMDISPDGSRMLFLNDGKDTLEVFSLFENKKKIIGYYHEPVEDIYGKVTWLNTGLIGVIKKVDGQPAALLVSPDDSPTVNIPIKGIPVMWSRDGRGLLYQVFKPRAVEKSDGVSVGEGALEVSPDYRFHDFASGGSREVFGPGLTGNPKPSIKYLTRRLIIFAQESKELGEGQLLALDQTDGRIRPISIPTGYNRQCYLSPNFRYAAWTDKNGPRLKLMEMPSDERQKLLSMK